MSSWIGEIEKVLMEDDKFDHRVETQPVPNDDFWPIYWLIHLLVAATMWLAPAVAVEKERYNCEIKADEEDDVKDLEMKSRYLKEECRQLSRVL
ncbi:hypothetical protein J1N35_041663 [Gossypium stocksii]|uniref:Uncharacterized protein n=1 Tax=Gossypium stocksii TaxID=47602 RepID=A0A9D3UGA1_9ROSI|nr:hypothetical protein J1N35_041663 [Gossypium stocksii]